jgi:tyrosyl-tRNA synthetase
VAQYWGQAAADAAADDFRKRSHGQDPDVIPEATLPSGQLDADGRMPVSRLIVALGLDTSTSGARRVIEQGGVNIGPDRAAITDPKATITVTDGLIVRVGKRKIARVRLPAG